MRLAARATYAAYGTLVILLGVVALSSPALLLPSDAYSPLAAHLTREQGAEGILVGLVSFWCLFNFDRRAPIHFALVLFTALFAAIHWDEYFHARRHLTSPLLNSLPFVAFLIISPVSIGRRMHSGADSKRA